METKGTLPSVVPTPSLAGRRSELALLQNRLTATAHGNAGVVLVVGEPGIGKTRLLGEAGAHATREGATVLRGGASEFEGMPPYLPLLEALGSYIKTAHLDVLRAQAGPVATTLASIFPELVARLGPGPVGSPMPPEQARLRLYEAVGTFLAALADARPVVLMLDDLHWADAASLDLLCHVVRHQPTARVIVVGAFREGEAEANPPLARAIEYLNRHRLLTTLMLSPLSAEEISALAASYLGGAVDPAASRLLYTQSEGNPFFAEELLRGWVETSGLVRQDEWWVPSHKFDPGRIPPGITGAIHQRLARLSPEIVGQLQTAAIIGRTFDVSLLAAVEARPAGVIELKMLAASRAGLIRADRTGTFAFSHDKIRECLYADMPPGRRRQLHEIIGRALEGRGDGSSVQQLAALAYHFARSGDRERGATYSLRAAEKALAVYAAEQALANYRAALDLLAADDVRRGEGLLGTGKAAILAGRAAEATDAYEAAHTWSLQGGDQMTAARAALGLSRARERLGDHQGHYAPLMTAVALLKDRSEPETVEALTWLAELDALRGNFTEGIAHAERASEVARVLGGGVFEAKACAMLGKLRARMNDIPAGLELLERALALAIEADDPSTAYLCCATLAFETHRAADMRRCREASLARIEFARRTHDPYQLHRAQAWLARLAAEQGKWSEAQQLIVQVESTPERSMFRETMEFLYRARGFIAYNRGDYEAAEREFQALAASLAQHREDLTSYQGLLGLVQLLMGKRREAQAYMAEQEALLAQLLEGCTPTAPILNCLAIMALTMGDRERAARYYRSLLPFRGQFHWFLVDRILALVETMQGDWAGAEAHFASAEATARREEIQPELPLTLVGKAELELTRGGRGSAICARTLLGQALNLFRELGMEAEAAHARERLRTLPRQPGASGHPAYPAGLSAREAQVLKLIAAGMSNRQIGRELSLSERTIANHITNIFNKTATENRAAATAFAIRHGLA